MKAKFVLENINFERGQDPKDSLSIGRIVERDIRKSLEELINLRGGKFQIIEDPKFVEGRYFFPGREPNESEFLFLKYYKVDDYFISGICSNHKIILEKIKKPEDSIKKIMKTHLPPL